MRAETADDTGPWRQQAVLGRTSRDADALRDVVRDYALDALTEPGATLVIDGTGFPKRGKASCGIGRQYTGSAGKITNCQTGGSICPRAGPATRTASKAYVPEDVRFATKPNIAAAMVRQAVDAEVPFAWVAADSVYGV